MVSLKNPIKTKKGDNMQKRKEQKIWRKNQEILSLRRESEEEKKSLKITMEARRRFCRGF